MSKLLLNSDNTQPDRDMRLDILRGICILGVVGIHFAGSFLGRPDLRWEPAFYVGLYWNQIFTFAVPVFIFLSGFLIGKKNYSSVAGFYSRRLISLLPQYFVVCIAWWFLFPKASFIQDLTWDNILIRIFYRGIQGTQYFVPAILQLFLLAPIIHWIVNFASKRIYKKSVFIFAGLILMMHLLLGIACFKGVLNYYYYCLPFSPFWLIFFFLGVYAERLFTPICNRIGRKLPSLFFLGGAVGTQTYNLYRCSTPSIAGIEVNTIPFDYAYSRPSMLVYDLCIAGCIAIILLFYKRSFPKWLHWFRFFGKYSYEIYLWHLVLLQYIGWGAPRVMQLCANSPVFIIGVCVVTCIIISLIRYLYDNLLKGQANFANESTKAIQPQDL